MVLEKTLESPLDCKEIQPVHCEGDQPWDFFGRNDAKVKLQYFGLLMGRTDSLQRPGCWESLKAGEKGTTEDNMVGWHYQLDGHELSKLQLLMMEGKPVVLQSMGSQRVGHN